MISYLIQGCLVWVAYGLLEYVFSSLVPLILSSEAVLGSWHGKLSAVLLASYGVLGLLAGGLAGLAPVSSRRRETICTLSLVLAALANLFAAQRPWYQNPSTAIYGMLAAALLFHLTSEWLALELAPLRNPWTAAMLLLAPTWIGRDLLAGSPVVWRTAGSLGLAAAIYWISLRIARRRTESRPARDLAVALAAAVVLLGFGGWSGGSRLRIVGPKPGQAAPANRPNVLMIVMDTVRADHLSVYGYPRDTTPNLRTFAREAVLYRNAAATSDVTLSSHASLFTGFYASGHGAHYAPDEAIWGRPLGPDIKTLAERLSPAGYWTAAVVANYGYLGPHFGLMRGFQHANHEAPVLLVDGSRDHYLREGVRRLLARFVSTSEFFMQSRRAAEINRDAYAVLDRAKQERAPFFLFLNYMDAHAPCIPPSPYDRLFPGLDPAFTHERFNEMSDAVMSLKRSITEGERRHVISQYDGGIAYLDGQLGRLLARLKELGLYDNTLIVVTSDHGESLGDRNFLEHAGISVYQDQIHIPLIIKYPGAVRKGVVEETASLVDVAPTVLETGGSPVPLRLPGHQPAGVSRRRNKRALRRLILVMINGLLLEAVK